MCRRYVIDEQRRIEHADGRAREVWTYYYSDNTAEEVVGPWLSERGAVECY